VATLAIEPNGMRGTYPIPNDLSREDQLQIERILAVLPLLADVTHADLLVYVAAADVAHVLYHASPNPVPSLYPQVQVGRLVDRRDAQPVFRVLRDGRDHETVSGTLIWGAPTLQEVFPIRSEDGRIIAVVHSVSNLMEHERFHRQGTVFRSAVSRVREQGLSARLPGAAAIGRLTEHDGILIVDNHGIIHYMNSVAENQYRRVGYVDSLLGSQISVLDTNEYICFRSMERGVCLEQRIQEQDQIWIKRAIPVLPQPSRRLLRKKAAPELDTEGALIYIQDITDEVRREQELKIKSAMIQEVHHRVKNNLQTVATLLRMEASRAGHPEVKETLRQTVGRVLSIAVVHEFLSRGETSEINIRDVCNRIVSEVTGGLMDPGKHVDVSVDGVNFSLPAQQATSCALVLNELLQNAVEHGFAGRDRGRIAIRFCETESSMVIEIADDGVGLPPGFDPSATRSLGLKIVQTLVKDDLRGKLDLQNRNGTTASISFPMELCRPVL
jgi:two-component system, sensor histidine kinase PdtaS